MARDEMEKENKQNQEKRRKWESNTEETGNRHNRGKNTSQSIMKGYSYTPGSAVTQAQENLNAYQSNKPADYENRWKDQLDTMLRDILDRKEFSYHVNADPLFQQYRDQYIRNGQLAMRDTMGQAAQLTGGYGNSYADQAGQQAYNSYMQGLNDRIPELYDLAMQAYNNKTSDMMNRYSLMGNQEGKEYSRYQDSVNAYNAELERLQNLFNTERSYDYGQYRDKVADEQQRWANAWAMFVEGVATPEILAILGLPKDYLDEAAVDESGGGGGGGGGVTNKKSSGTSYADIYEAVSKYVAGGDNSSATKTVAAATKENAVTSAQKETLLRYIQGNGKRS